MVNRLRCLWALVVMILRVREGQVAHGLDTGLGRFFHIWCLSDNVSSEAPEEQWDRLPPGALGGMQGSGCFQFSKRFSVSAKRLFDPTFVSH